MSAINSSNKQKSSTQSANNSVDATRVSTPASMRTTIRSPDASSKVRSKSPVRDIDDDEIERLLYQGSTPKPSPPSTNLVDRIKAARSRANSEDLSSRPASRDMKMSTADDESTSQLAERIKLSRSKRAEDVSSPVKVSSPSNRGGVEVQQKSSLAKSAPDTKMSIVDRMKMVKSESEVPELSKSFSDRVKAAQERAKTLKSPEPTFDEDALMSPKMQSASPPAVMARSASPVALRSASPTQKMQSASPMQKASPSVRSVPVSPMQSASPSIRSVPASPMQKASPSQTIVPASPMVSRSNMPRSDAPLPRSSAPSPIPASMPRSVPASPASRIMTLDERVLEAKSRIQERKAKSDEAPIQQKPKSIADQLSEIRRSNEAKSADRKTTKMDQSRDIGTGDETTSSLLRTLTAKSGAQKSIAEPSSMENPFDEIAVMREGEMIVPEASGELVITPANTQVNSVPPMYTRTRSIHHPEYAHVAPKTQDRKSRTVTENTKRCAEEAFVEEATTLKLLGMTVLDYYPIAGENKALILAKTPYRNKVVVVVNLKGGKLLYNSNGKYMRECDPHPMLEKVLDEGIFNEEAAGHNISSSVGMFFNIFDRAIVAFNEDNKIVPTFYETRALESTIPVEAHPYPIVKFELLTQGLDATKAVILDIENAAHIMMHKHMMKIFNKNDEIAKLFDTGIQKIQEFESKLSTLKSEFVAASDMEKYIIRRKYTEEFSALVGALSNEPTNAQIAEQKEVVQEKFYTLLGRMRQMNRIKLIYYELHRELENLKETTLKNAVASELSKFMENK